MSEHDVVVLTTAGNPHPRFQPGAMVEYDGRVWCVEQVRENAKLIGAFDVILMRDKADA